jgi:glycosyltransferase involved in cell wall biosynthesis
VSEAAATYGGAPRTELGDVRPAIVHDWFQGFHGAERVVEAMRAALAENGSAPDVFTFHAERRLLPPELAAAIVKESRLAALPGIRQRGHEPGRWRYLLPYMPRYFAGLDLGGYDFVVASSHACALHARPRADALFLCYCHTPMRYAWMRDVDSGRVRGLKAVGMSTASGWLRRLDADAAARPDAFIANSQAVRDRIRAFYGRDAEVIHPPVDVEEFDASADKDPDHFLWAHRLVAYKRPEVVVEAFRGLPYRLTMVGVGPLASSLRRNLPPNVELRPWLSRRELVRLYATSSGFVHVGEEDFGITMVEALASGTPVIALARGGARDIVRSGIDGVLLERPDVALLREAVHRVSADAWDRDALAARAREFSRERFVDRFIAYASELRR